MRYKKYQVVLSQSIAIISAGHTAYLIPYNHHCTNLLCLLTASLKYSFMLKWCYYWFNPSNLIIYVTRTTQSEVKWYSIVISQHVGYCNADLGGFGGWRRSTQEISKMAFIKMTTRAARYSDQIDYSDAASLP